MGDVRQIITGRNGQLQDLSEAQVQVLTKKAAFLAAQEGASRGRRPGHGRPRGRGRRGTRPADRGRAAAAPRGGRGRPGPVPGRRRSARNRGHVLTLTGDEAASFGLGQVVANEEELKGLYGLRGKLIRVDGPTWVDSLVTVLTDPYVSWLLLFVGLFMLVIELKLPGIGLPAITSALAFLLFFWSHYLSGTADQLEIILFLVGMVCLALELFVFPGFGVFGMAGILLMLASIVMASHTFVWPTQEYEYREMGYTLLQLTVALVAVAGGAVVLARYFPSLPLFNRLVLKPEPWTGVESDDPTAKPPLEGYESLAFLIGETGRTTSPLRPTGKARFGNLLIDVTADGFYVEPDSPRRGHRRPGHAGDRQEAGVEVRVPVKVWYTVLLPAPYERLKGTAMAKHIFVTGGVVSSLGKGLTCASIGMLLEHRGLRVRLQKFDPYINVDPGHDEPLPARRGLRPRRRRPRPTSTSATTSGSPTPR